jgi:hypothetical protein
MTGRRRVLGRLSVLMLGALASACAANADPKSDQVVLVSVLPTTSAAADVYEGDATVAEADGVLADERVAEAGTEPAGEATGETTVEPSPDDAGPDEADATDDELAEIENLRTADLALSPDGVGPYDFGTPIIRVLDALSALLGPAMSDVVAVYTPDDSGRLVDDDGFAFAYPFGRQTCFASGLCVESGASDTSDLRLVGWSLAEGEGEQPATLGGLRPGDRLGETTEAIIDPLGCGVFGTGRLGGLELELLSTAGAFPDRADDASTPAPLITELVVVGLSAGSLRTATFEPC